MRKSPLEMRNKKTHLLIIFHDLGIGGIQKRIVDIVEYLKKNKAIEVSLYIKSHSKNQNNPRYIKKILSSGAKIIYRPKWTIGTHGIGTSLHLIWTVITVQPDIILTFLRELSIVSIVLSRFIFWEKIKVVINEGILTSAHLTNELPCYSRFIWKQAI